MYWDAGTMLANLLAVAESYGLRPRVLLGFVDSAVCRLIGIDGVAEFPVAVIPIGPATEPHATGRSEPTGPRLAATALSPAPVEFPLTTRVQQAGNLTTTEQVAAWRAVSVAGLPHAPDTVDPPVGAEPIESVVLRRGSTRRMRRVTAAAQLLHWPMAVATRHLPADAIPYGASLLSHELTVHAVQGTDPGLYHWGDGGARLCREAPEREVRGVRPASQ